MMWEYDAIAPGGLLDQALVKLNEMGIQGWDCFAIAVHNGKAVYYMKRPLANRATGEEGE